MTRRLALSLLLICFVAGRPGVVSAAAQERSEARPGAVRISLDRANQSARLGASFALDSTISNVGSRPLSGLVAHLKVVSLTAGVYVDPEDWSPQRTRYLGPLAPRESVRIGWRVDAVSRGRFAVYVVAIPRRSPGTPSVGLAIGPPLSLASPNAAS
jgi:hypothetical protein